MTETVAPAIKALFGSVIRPVSDASADCAWSMPRSSTPSNTPRTNLRMETPVHSVTSFGTIRRFLPPHESRKTTISQSGRERKSLGLSDPCDTADIANLYQLRPRFCWRVRKPFCLEKHLQSDVCFVAPLAELSRYAGEGVYPEFHAWCPAGLPS